MSIKFLKMKKTNYFFIISFFLFLFFSTASNAQTGITVSGTVIDALGQTIPGATVLEKGTKNATSTDLDGKFKIKVAGSKSILVFSYMGYETISQTVEKKTTLNIVLKSEAAKLEEVVVIGYGTTRKADLTGSVAVISGNDLKKVAVNNVSEALTGKVAGVRVTSAEGSPDSDINIRVRGGGSLTQDGSPLIIVDGFPVLTLADISASDVESMTVLKDASSTAIYGSKGANGVILVTTKKGGKDGGKVSVSINRSYGFKKIAKYIAVQSPQDFANWQYESILMNNQNVTTAYNTPFGGAWSPTQFEGVKGTNWQKEVYGRNGVVVNTDLSVRGGTDKLSYNINAAQIDEEAIMIGSNYKRDNLSLNFKSKANEKIDITFGMRYSDTHIEGGGANDQNEKSSQDARFRHAVGYAPIDLTNITTDDVDELTAGSIYNISPIIAVADNNRYQDRKNYNMQGSFQWKVSKNLQYKTELGMDNYFISDIRYYGRSTYNANYNAGTLNGYAILTFLDRKDVRYRNTNTLNFDFKKYLADENHNLKILVGEETLITKSTEKLSELHGLPKSFTFDNAITLSSQAKDAKYVNNYVYPDNKLLSFFGRLNYDYKSRYLFTATFRADGSSKFSGSNKWGYFPSSAVAWKMSEESFLKDVSWIQLLKLRASYGESGNENIPVGQALQTFQSYPDGIYINNVTSYWATSKILFNPALKWETTVTQNLGLDYEIFKGRITGNVEIYKNITKDLLIKFPLFTAGYEYQYRNVGEVQNTGLESTLNLAIIDKKDFNIDFSFNIGFNKNRINSLGSLIDYRAATGWQSSFIADPNEYIVNVGGPIGQMYGFVSAGRYEVSDFNYNGSYTLKPGVPDNTSITGTPTKPGSMKLVDLNEDGVVDLKDRKVIGNANPIHTGGFSINTNYHDFDLSANFNWSYGNDVYNADKIHTSTSLNNFQYRNLASNMQSGIRWNNLDPASGALVTDPTQLAALNANTSMWTPYSNRYVFSDWAVEDGSFLRLNTLSLGYSMNKDVISKIGIAKLRFYITASNVFVWTKYSGMDPEVSTRRQTPLTPGVDYSPYPRSRQIICGFNLNF
jgi:TonB-linked SusC/RagA family outer membrane protein